MLSSGFLLLLGSQESPVPHPFHLSISHRLTPSEGSPATCLGELRAGLSPLDMLTRSDVVILGVLPLRSAVWCPTEPPPDSPQAS